MGVSGEIGMQREDEEGKTYEVWVSLLPLHMMTSAGLVLVWRALSVLSSPRVAFLNRPMAVLATLPRSPLLYADTIPNSPCPASFARLGSLSTPLVL